MRPPQRLAILMGLSAVLVASATVAADRSTPAADPVTADQSVFDHPATIPQLSGLLGEVAKQLGSAAALQGAFTQRKQLSGLPKPLVSSGDFFVMRGTGVDWHTRVPFDSDLVLMPQALIQRCADGATTRTDASQQPGLRAVSQVFDALFALDLDKLSQTFALFGQPPAKSGGDWILGLQPREPAFARIIQRIVVTGAAQPSRIVLFEGNGDRTAIDFSGVTTLAAVSEADRQRFAP